MSSPRARSAVTAFCASRLHRVGHRQYACEHARPRRRTSSCLRRASRRISGAGQRLHGNPFATRAAAGCRHHDRWPSTVARAPCPAIASNPVARGTRRPSARAWRPPRRRADARRAPRRPAVSRSSPHRFARPFRYRDDVGHRGTAFGERARLVEDDRRDLAGPLQRFAAFDQHAQRRAAAASPPSPPWGRPAPSRTGTR